MGSYLLAAPAPDASATVRGLLNTVTQTLAGLKTFRDGLEAHLGTAGASDVAMKVGTRVADGSVHNAARLFSVRTGIGGVEKEILAVRRPQSYDYGVPFLSVDQQVATNTFGIAINNAGAGVSGFAIGWSGGGGLSLGGEGGHNGVTLGVVNKGLRLSQNANAYDSSALMRFAVNTASGVASTVPLFDYQGPANIKLGQRIASWKINSIEQIGLYADGSIVSSRGGTSGDVAVRLGTDVAAASVNVGADILRVSSGIGGTESIHMRLRRGASGETVIYTSGAFILADDSVSRIFYGTSGQVALQGRAGASSASIGVQSKTDRAQPDNSLLHLFTNYTTDKAKVWGNGEWEQLVSGSGIILPSPDGTRWRLTITNAGAVNVAAA